MLKQRIITALLLIPLVVWSIFALSSQNFTYALAGILFLATLEWNNLVSYNNKAMAWFFSFVTTTSYLYINYVSITQVNEIVISLALVWWIVALPLLCRFPFQDNHVLHQKPVKIIVGFVMLLSTFIALNILRNTSEYGPDYVMYLLLVIWFADSGAYFAGRAWGKHKLLPKVSPGKTWEGVAGAIAVTGVVALIAVNILKISSAQSVFFIIITLITVVYSVVGDLSESMFKRMVNIKDSGQLLPGHGGILDRIDSLMSALPVFITGLWIMERLA